MRTILFSLIAGVLLGAANPAFLRGADDPPRPLKVFVFVGTSNMLGRNAKPEDLPDDLRAPLADVLVYQGQWTPLEAGKNLVGNEAAFGRAMAKHLGEPVGIAWISVRYAATPLPVEKIQNIVKQSREKGRPIEIAGLLVDVSYGDGQKKETAEAYGEGMVRWIEAARRDLGNEKLPIVLMRAIPPKSSTSHLETVRQAADKLKLPGFRVVSSDGAERGGDQVHFTTAGRLEMGKRYAAAMMELLPAKK